jgi:hypothetical protein
MVSFSRHQLGLKESDNFEDYTLDFVNCVEDGLGNLKYVCDTTTDKHRWYDIVSCVFELDGVYYKGFYNRSLSESATCSDMGLSPMRFNLIDDDTIVIDMKEVDRKEKIIYTYE